MVETSSSKPRYQRSNQLLGKIHELEVLDREIKRNNARLTKKNTELRDSFLEMRGMYILQQKRNLRLMKDNSRLYRIIRLSRLEKKNSNPISQAQLALETLSEAAISLQDPEVAHDVADILDIMQVEEGIEDQE